MSDSSTPQFSWTCVSCGRLVPNRLAECRCGQARGELTAGAPNELPVASPAERRAGGALSWIVLGVVAAAAAGTLVYLQVKPIPVAAPHEIQAEDAPSGHVGSQAPDEPARSEPPFVLPDLAVAPVAPVAPGTLEDVISRSLPAMVSIEAGQSRGSGFFVSAGTIVTNRHVTQGYTALTVRLSNGQTLHGRVDVSSPEHDLAIVRVSAAPANQAVLSLGNVSEVRPGQEVVAIGLALGVFQNSVTRGIISAVRQANRTVVLQTDAAINPGNSGGPLLNRHGLVVGVTTMKVTGAAESLGFAVASDHVRSLLSGGTPFSPAPAAGASNQALASVFTPKSSADIMREEGTRRYQQIVESAARRSAELDHYWSRIKANCQVRPAAGYDREWFGLWDGRTTAASPDSSCMSAMRELQQLAGDVQSVMSAAGEAGRRAAVLPGELRSIRRRYRMDWPGFD